MSLLDVSPGGASRFSFSPFGTMTLGPSNPSVVMTGTFSPDVKGHYSAVLVIAPDDPNIPPDYTLLHGVGTGAGVNPLGTAESWYTIDEWYFYNDDYNFAKMIELKSTGATGYFGDLYEIQDPFLRSGNNVFADQWSDIQSNLSVYGGTEYVMDSDLFGPYTEGDPENTAATETRLINGEVIGRGGILKTSAFINDTDLNKDIICEGTVPLLMDIAPDGTIFYTETLFDVDVIRTRLKWQKGTAGGTAEEDISMRLTGQQESEPRVMRAISVGSAYRIFLVFDTQVFDIDLNSSHVITATKELTSLLSAIPAASMRIDSSGGWVTVVSDVPGHIQVFKENLHSGGRTLFAQAAVPFPDTVFDCMVDKLGNCFVQTNAGGIYQFSPTGTPMHYVLAGYYFYSSNQLGSNPDNYKCAEWYVGFEKLWFGK